MTEHRTQPFILLCGWLNTVMTSIGVSAAVVLTCSLVGAAEPPRDWVDAQTGHRVIRLSDVPGSVSLYFHQNAYTPAGDKLLISTPRGLETVDLRTRELKVVVPRRSYQLGGSSGVEVGRKSRHVYYSVRTREGTTVRATHLDTGDTRDIVTMPFGASFNGVNADETLLFGAMREIQAGDRTRSRSRNRNRQPTTDRSMKLFTASLSNGEIRTFHPAKAWLNHLQCSPTDPNFGLFCHEGTWHDVDRVWTIPFGADEARLMHSRQQQYEIAGHEFFSADGQWVWYDLQTPRADQFWLAGVHIKTGERIRYRIARGEWSVHYNISKDGKLFAGDGGGPESVANQTPLPEKRRLNPARNGQWIYLFRPDREFIEATISGEPGKSGTVTAERLVDLSSHDYDLEPNVTFTPDGQWVVFRSNMHGERHVYMVSVNREAESEIPPKPESAAAPPKTAREKQRLVLIGDSTVKNGKGQGDGGLYGWGQVLHKHFDNERIEVENRALGGRSSRTYLTEGLWQKSLTQLHAGDFVIMQFGHNDGGKMFEGDRPRASIKGNGEEAVDGVVQTSGEKETVRSFGWYLRKYVADAKAVGAVPIVLSPIPRDRWQNGHVMRSDKDYGLWARQAAEQSGAYFIDLNDIVARRYEQLGEVTVGADLFPADDWTHTTLQGAEVNALCVVEGIKQLRDCPLRDFLLKHTAQISGTWRFDFGEGPAASGFTSVTPASKYDSQPGYGFEAGATVVSQQIDSSDPLNSDSISSEKPFFFSTALPEGNYRVRIRTWEPGTVIKTEVRRVMNSVSPASLKDLTPEFIANIRRPTYAPGAEVRLKPRELTSESKSWDEKLTIEFNGAHPNVSSMEITAAPDVPTIFLAGDSTVADQAIEPAGSWGQMLPQFFRPDVAIANHAESGETIRSSMAAGRFRKIFSQIRPGDYLFFQFGHNDMKDRAEDAVETYRQNLTKLVRRTIDAGATPVLVTSMERNRKPVRNTLGSYPETVRDIGRSLNVPVIDLHVMSKQLYTALGNDVDFAFVDGTHHSNYGSWLLAQCVVLGIRNAELTVAESIIPDFRFDLAEPPPFELFNIPATPDEPAAEPGP